MSLDRHTSGEDLRAAFRRLATGVTVVTAATPDGPAGMTCNSVVSASLDPPLVLFCPARSSTTWPSMSGSVHFAINVLGAAAGPTAQRFAARGIDRFSGTRWGSGQTGCPLLEESIVWIECRSSARHACGDHEIVIGEVLTLGVRPGQPLVFHEGELFALPVPRAEVGAV